MFQVRTLAHMANQWLIEDWRLVSLNFARFEFCLRWQLVWHPTCFKECLLLTYFAKGTNLGYILPPAFLLFIVFFVSILQISLYPSFTQSPEMRSSLPLSSTSFPSVADVRFSSIAKLTAQFIHSKTNLEGEDWLVILLLSCSSGRHLTVRVPFSPFSFVFEIWKVTPLLGILNIRCVIYYNQFSWRK